MINEKNRLENFFESDALNTFFENGIKNLEKKYRTVQNLKLNPVINNVLEDDMNTQVKISLIDKDKDIEHKLIEDNNQDKS